MIKRLLVTTDGSSSAEIGVRYAVALAEEQGASLLAHHVVDIKLLEGPILRDLASSLGTAPYVNYQGSISMLLDERGKTALAYARSLCEKRGIPCETSLQTGIVPHIICEKAELVENALRELRKKVTFAIFAETDDLDRVTARVDALFTLLEKADRI